jgi:DNA-directed RNA polymerase specialized sigma24 family protein
LGHHDEADITHALNRSPVDPFPGTHWTMILHAGQGHEEALEELCDTYWYPLYAYTRRRGLGEQDAQDRVQGFLADVLGRGDLAKVDQDRGKFRAWLLTAMRHFLSKQWDHERALKRGGGQLPLSLDWARAEGRYAVEPVDIDDAEVLYARRWALTLLDRVRERLRGEYEHNDKQDLFDRLQGALTGEGLTGSYREVGEELGLSEGAVKVAVHRMRKRFGRVLRQEVAHTVDGPEAVDDELRHLISVLGS